MLALIKMSLKVSPIRGFQVGGSVVSVVPALSRGHIKTTTKPQSNLHAEPPGVGLKASPAPKGAKKTSPRLVSLQTPTGLVSRPHVAGRSRGGGWALAGVAQLVEVLWPGGSWVRAGGS